LEFRGTPCRSCGSLEHLPEEAPDVELNVIGLNFAYAALGVVLMWVSYRVFDLMTPKVDFAEELKKGNVAVAIFIGALFIAIAMIVGNALN